MFRVLGGLGFEFEGLYGLGLGFLGVWGLRVKTIFKGARGN